MRNIVEVIGMEGQVVDVAEFVRRSVFCVSIGNAGMHLIYSDRQTASIEPAYDFVATAVCIPDDSKTPH